MNTNDLTLDVYWLVLSVLIAVVCYAVALTAYAWWYERKRPGRWPMPGDVLQWCGEWARPILLALALTALAALFMVCAKGQTVVAEFVSPPKTNYTYRTVNVEQWLVTNREDGPIVIFPKTGKARHAFTGEAMVLRTNKTMRFAGFIPGTLDAELHRVNMNAARGRSNWIYAFHAHTHPTSTDEFATNPAAKPVFQRHQQSVIRLWGGHTGISHCNTLPGGAWGQLNMTLITRRHAYLRGHDTGRDPSKPTGHIYTNYAGHRVFFCTTSNTVVAMTISNRTVRAWVGEDNDDFGLVIFTEDVPDSIEPVWIVRYYDVVAPATDSARAMRRRVGDCAKSGGPVPVVDWWVSQDASCGLTGPTRDFDTWRAPITNPYWPRAGDSGGPMFLVISNHICVYRGLTTFGYENPDRLLSDLNALTKSVGLDTNLYQPRYVDVSRWPVCSLSGPLNVQ